MLAGDTKPNEQKAASLVLPSRHQISIPNAPICAVPSLNCIDWGISKCICKPKNDATKF